MVAAEGDLAILHPHLVGILFAGEFGCIEAGADLNAFHRVDAHHGGSQLGVDETGAMVGSVSGGCIEGAVVKEALAAIADGKPRMLDFGVTDEQAWDVGLACGGKVQVFVEKVG